MLEVLLTKMNEKVKKNQKIPPADVISGQFKV